MLKTYSILSTNAEEFTQFINEVFLDIKIRILMSKGRYVVHLYDYGEIFGSIDESPIFLMDKPEKVYNHLWKAGSLHIQKTGISKRNPELYKATKKIQTVLDGMNVIWCNDNLMSPSRECYYLRGSLQNISWKIIALGSGLEHLDRKWHFVSAFDNQSVINTVQKSLTLLGLKAIE